MKNLKIFLITAIGIMLSLSPAATAVSHICHTGTLATTAIVLVAGVVLCAISKNQLNRGYATNNIQVEIWAQYIIDRLFKDNTFLSRAYSDDQYVLAGKIVHIPNPGAAPIVTKNRSSYPATAVRRTDTDIVYTLDEYTTAPTHIPDAEKVELSYDKITSVYGDHAGYLAEFVASDLILKWLDETVTSVTKRLTTGGSTAITTAATSAAATGTRYLCHHEDVRKLQLLFNTQNVPTMGRQILFESNMLDQVIQSLSNTQYRDFSQYVDATNGTVGRLYGFDFLQRSQVATAAADDTIKALGAAGATTDCSVSVAWQKDCVTRALGEVKFFEDLNRPEYYGDIYSALLRMGARRRRADDIGVVALIQGQN